MLKNVRFTRCVHLVMLLLSVYTLLHSEEQSIAPTTEESTTPKRISKKKSPNATKTPAAEQQEQASIYLNFDNATLSSVVSFLGQQKNINIIPNKALETIKVSLSTRKPLTLSQAWNVMLTLLETNQFSLIDVNGTYRITQSSLSKQQPLPLYMHAPEALPSSDLMIRYVYLFKNIKPDAVRPILDQILSVGAVNYSTNLNTCVITEKSINIKNAMKIVQELDSGGLRESIKIIQLKEASADQLAEFINKNLTGASDQQAQRIIQIQPRQENSYFSKNIKVIPDIYNNSLIMLGTEADLKRLIDFIQTELDCPLESRESRLHIKELKYTYAEKIKSIVDAVIKPPTRDPKSTIVGQVRYFEDMVVAAEAAPPQASATTTPETKSVSIGAGNRLIIACNRDDWTRIEAFIDKLDKPQPQVALEVLFADVTLEKDTALGTQLNTKKPNILGNYNNFETQFIEPLTPNPGFQNEMNIFPGTTTANGTNEFTAGAAFASVGKAGSVWAIAKSVLQSNNVEVLSQPYLVVNNHQKTLLEFAETRNLADRIDPSSTTAVQKNKEISAKTQVEITPSINLDGIISLNIIIKIDNFINPFTANPQTSGARNNRHLQTQAMMADGEVLILGGLIQTRMVEVINKTPVLGDIPIIGNLFRYRTQQVVQNELNIFIRPSLIKPRFEGTPEDYTQLKLDYAKIQIGRQADFLSTKDPIQRWFFQPQRKSEDFKQIDEFTEGKYQPRSVIIPIDPYYKTETSRTIQRLEERRKNLIAADQRSAQDKTDAAPKPQA